MVVPRDTFNRHKLRPLYPSVLYGVMTPESHIEATVATAKVSTVVGYNTVRLCLS